jgi:hypothetical protein
MLVIRFWQSADAQLLALRNIPVRTPDVALGRVSTDLRRSRHAPVMEYQ